MNRWLWLTIILLRVKVSRSLYLYHKPRCPFKVNIKVVTQELAQLASTSSASIISSPIIIIESLAHIESQGNGKVPQVTNSFFLLLEKFSTFLYRRQIELLILRRYLRHKKNNLSFEHILDSRMLSRYIFFRNKKELFWERAAT